MENRESPLLVRLNDAERAILREGASLKRQALTIFIREAALRAAKSAIRRKGGDHERIGRQAAASN